MQLVPIKPTLKAPVTKRLKLKYDKLLSSFAFNFNLRHYILGQTRLNVWAGLAAFYIVYPDVVNKGQANKCDLQSLTAKKVTLECLFPRDTPYDLPLVLQDRSFKNPIGVSPGVNVCQCFGNTAAEGGADGLWQPEYFGRVPTVNGKIAPMVVVDPRGRACQILPATSSTIFLNPCLSSSERRLAS